MTDRQFEAAAEAYFDRMHDERYADADDLAPCPECGDVVQKDRRRGAGRLAVACSAEDCRFSYDPEDIY